MKDKTKSKFINQHGTNDYASMLIRTKRQA